MILHRNQKGFLLGAVCKRLKGIFSNTKNKKGTQLKKTSNAKAVFPLFKEQLKKFVALLTKEKGKVDTIAYLTVFTCAFWCITNKGKTTMHEWENDDADKLQALCSRYKRLG